MIGDTPDDARGASRAPDGGDADQVAPWAARARVRLDELAGLADHRPAPAQMEAILGDVASISTALGQPPGLYLEEHDHVEARWHLGPVQLEQTIVSVTFVDAQLEVYVYDRATGHMTESATFAAGLSGIGDLVNGLR